MRKYYANGSQRAELAVYANGMFDIVEFCEGEEPMLVSKPKKAKGRLYCKIDDRYDSEFQISGDELRLFVYDRFGRTLGESVLYECEGGEEE